MTTTLSLRARKVLAAVLLLPEGGDGWRRATYRDQLHESVPDLSRGAVARSLAAGELDGLVVVQGVGQSARLPEGYKLTEHGGRVAREVGSIQPDPVSRASSDPVLGSRISLGPSGDTEKQDRTTDRTDPVATAADPVTTRLALDDRTLSVLYAAVTQTPICLCVRPMHPKQQHKTGTWFWGCVLGRKKGGCGITAPMRYQPKRQDGGGSGKAGRARDVTNLGLQEVMQLVSERRKA